MGIKAFLTATILTLLPGCLLSQSDLANWQATGGEIFLSHQLGAGWTALGGGFSGHPLLSLWPSGDYLFAGLSGGGAWKHLLSEIKVTSDSCAPPLLRKSQLSRAVP